MEEKGLVVRSVESADYDKVIEFLNTNLRPEMDWSIEQEYPTVFQKKESPYLRIIENESGVVLSHAAWKPTIIKTELGLFKVAVIGSVVTSKKERNKGLSTKIIESVLQEASLCGCEFAMLWTDQFDFYRKFNFELAGVERTAVIHKPINALENLRVRILNTNKILPEDLNRLFQNHTVSSVRTLDDLQLNLQIPNSRIYSAWSTDNKLLAYAVEGKGGDFDSYIHEWAGDIKHLKCLVNHIYREQKRNLHWMIPGHSQNLIKDLENEGIYVHQGFLGMIKILNYSSLFSKINRFARGPKMMPKFFLEKADGKFRFGVDDRVFETDNEAMIVQLLFGPLNLDSFKGIDDSTKKDLMSVLPIKMWIWGWDSI